MGGGGGGGGGRGGGNVRQVPDQPQGTDNTPPPPPINLPTNGTNGEWSGPPDWQTQQISGTNAGLDPLNQFGSGTFAQNNPTFDPLNQGGSGTNNTQWGITPQTASQDTFAQQPVDNSYSQTNTGYTDPFAFNSDPNSNTGGSSAYDPFANTNNAGYDMSSSYDPYASGANSDPFANSGGSSYDSSGGSGTGNYDPFANYTPPTDTSGGSSSYDSSGGSGTGNYDPFANYTPPTDTSGGSSSYNPQDYSYNSSSGSSTDPYAYDTSGGNYGYTDTSGGSSTDTSSYTPPPDTSGSSTDTSSYNYGGGDTSSTDTSSGADGGPIGYAQGGSVRRRPIRPVGPQARGPSYGIPPAQPFQGAPNSYRVPGARQMTTGGKVTPQMSPTGGQATDDVPARLNVGEYVIPKDVAAWKGHEFFQKMIDQSRAARQGATAKPKDKPALPNQGQPTFQSKRMG